MALDEANLALNVRRLAGMHLASIESLAEYIGISRQAMQAMVSFYPSKRSMPRTDTAIRLSEAFGVSLNALYQEPAECLREAVDGFERAPLREFVDQRLHDNALPKSD
jgi:transcriptional regulator with XRE-family HTH domain